MIKGMTVTLVQKVENGRDAFNHPVYLETEININDVLVSPVSSQDIIDTLNMTGKKAVLTLCIPKTDRHDWESKTVIIDGRKYNTIGKAQHYISGNVPMRWNDRIQVEVYE